MTVVVGLVCHHISSAVCSTIRSKLLVASWPLFVEERYVGEVRAVQADQFSNFFTLFREYSNKIIIGVKVK
jgi:hypothetical protein